MSVHPFPYKLYLVISEADCLGKNFLEVAEQAILGGVDVIQLREKMTVPSFLSKRQNSLLPLQISIIFRSSSMTILRSLKK